MDRRDEDEMDILELQNVQLGGVDYVDLHDLSNAFILYAEDGDGNPIDEETLKELSEDKEMMKELAEALIWGTGEMQ